MANRLDELRKGAARAYMRYHEIAEAREYSCGMSMAAFINPELGKLARQFNECMAILKQADPKCPDYHKLPEGDK